jgi:hypothetical protein
MSSISHESSTAMTTGFSMVMTADIFFLRSISWH